MNDQAITSCVQPMMCALLSLAYNDLSPQGAIIWQQLSEKDKALLISITSKQQRESTGNSTNDVTDGNRLDWNEPTNNYTRKCCRQRGTPYGELLQFKKIVDHKEMDINDGNSCDSPYLLTILWQNGKITDVPINQVMHDSPRECTKYTMSNGLSIHGDDYDRILITTQLTHALMKLVFVLKSGNVLLAIELYDAFHFKLLLLDINDSNRLMSEIYNKKINELLESIHQRAFQQRTIQQLMSLISEAQKLPAGTYNTQSMEIFDRDHVTGDDPEPDNIEDNKELREVLLHSALDMKKLFPMRWTNKVLTKFVDIGIQTPRALPHHITHGILNPLLNQHKYLTMNHSTLGILADASPSFRTDRSHQFGYNQG